MIQKLFSTVFVLFIFAGNSYAQISPGELSRGHEMLEGLSNCTKCHDLGKQVSAAKCLACHTEIGNLISQNRGYHSSSEVRSKNCWTCHNEHHGKDFQIIRFEKKNFDHRKTTFEHTGKHGTLDCNECHQSKNIKDPKLKLKKKTFLGLSHACNSCHEDVHQKALGDNCSNCHTTQSFKPASKFDHANAKFKLIGKHATTDCVKCHKKDNQKDGKTVQKFTGLNFINCTPCHDDFHKGKFGVDCKKCHNPSNFHAVNTSQFDHNKTNFALDGKHALVKCESCHTKERGTRPRFDKCTSCHKDYHAGQFTDVDKSVTDCKVCHTVHGFSPSQFTLERHAQTKFALQGGHLSVPCNQCHNKGDKWQFKDVKSTCVNCHENIHGNELTKEFLGDNECQNCHATNSWKEIKFDHSRTKFMLSGKHAVILCKQCHFRLNDDTKKREYKFVSTNMNCDGCHSDVHFGQFKVESPDYCLKCHTNDDWQPVKFNHGKTQFSLSGAHAKVACIACHKEVIREGNRYVLFKIGDFRCIACHS